MRALHLSVALLLVCSTVGAAVPAGPPSTASDARSGTAAVADPDAVRQTTPGPPPGAFNVLDVRQNVTNRSALDEAYVDLGPALGFGTAASSHRLETLAAVERVRTAGEADRDERLRREIARIEDRSDALAADQRRALQAYVREETGPTELLVALARVDREARALEERRDRLVDLSNRSDVDLDGDRLARLDRELDLYTGSVRARAAAALAGESPPRRFYVAATPESVVLATLTENAYLREAYRGDLRRVADRELTPRDTLEAVQREYPDVWAARERASFDGGRIGTGRVEYGGGTLEVAAGSGNGRVFADEHRLALDAAATNLTAVNTRDGLRLTVNRTYAGGPMRIELRDSDGDPVDADVTVGPAGGESVTVGATGIDGVLWALTPGERYTVVAIRGQSVVFLTQDPLPVPRAGTGGGGNNTTASS